MKLELDVNSPQNSYANSYSAGNGFNSESSDVKEMLRSGITLAKNGNRAEARQLLLRVTEAEPINETAWLWLASISEYPEELLIFLQNVLNINPVNERALEWAKATKTLLSKTLVQRGINASHENQKEFAKQCFLQAIVHDAENEMAWLWLASASDSTEEKTSHLQKVLNINPNNETALSSLKAVKNQLAQTLLKKANSAAIAGERESAREMLEDVMRQMPELEEAWILQAYLTDNFYSKIDCYEKVLTINPENEAAQAGLASLKALMQKTAELKPVISHQVAEVAAKEVVNEETHSAQEELLETSPEPMAELNDNEEVLETTHELTFESAEESLEAAQPQVQESAHEFFAPTFETSEESKEAVQENSSDNEKDLNYDAPVSNADYNFAQTENANYDSYLIEDTIVPNRDLDNDHYSLHTSVDTNDVQNQVLEAETPTDLMDFYSAEDTEKQQFKEEVSEEVDAAQPEVQEFSHQSETIFSYKPETSEDKIFELVEDSSDKENSSEVSSQNEFYSESTQHFVEPVQVEPAQTKISQFSNAVENEVVASTETEFAPESKTVESLAYDLSEFSSAPEHSNESTYHQQHSEYQATDNFDTSQQISGDPSYFEALSAKNYPSEQPYFEEKSTSQNESVQEVEAVQENEDLNNTQSFHFEEAFEPKIEEVQFKQEVEEVENTQSEVEIDNASEDSASVVIFNCPFCLAENEQLSIVCHSCRAMLSLSDLEMMLAHQEADQDVILQAVERLEIERSLREFDEKELMDLGIAHLNAKNLRKGYAYLNEASQMNPNDVVLGSKVNFLAIRLSEIETQENKAQENPVISKTILVVDDSPTVRKLISGKLEKCGHSVISAIDGMDALAKINEVIPDLVLLDITMPRLDGYQVCKLIRNNEITKNVPIVMISGKDGFFDKVRGRMAGSTGYITKPFGPDTLMKTIETYIS